MAGGEETPVCLEAEVFLMVAQVNKTFVVFVLFCTTIAPINDFLNKWQLLLDIVTKITLSLVDKAYVMVQVVRQNAK